MNKLILSLITKRLKQQKHNFLLTALTYYVVLAFIPTYLLTLFLLEQLGINVKTHWFLLDNLFATNWIANTSVSIVIFYMISRAFFILYQNRFSTIKSFFLTVLTSILLIIFLTFFVYSYAIDFPLLSITLRMILTCFFLFFIYYFTSISSLKYSIIFSCAFSVISNIFLYFFRIITSFFINYETYYGSFSPIFIIILTLHLLIYILYIGYVCAEEFTKISSIKFVKG